MTQPNILDRVIASKELLECESYMSGLFTGELSQTEKKEFVKRLAMFLSPMAMQLCGFLCNQSTFLMEGHESVRAYVYLWLANYLSSPTSVVLKHLKELCADIRNEYSYAEGTHISAKFIEDLMTFLDESYGFCINVCDRNPIGILQYPNSNIYYNAQYITLGAKQSIILLYHPKGNCYDSREYIFMHELGHIVHTHLYSYNDVPDSFRHCVRKLGLKINSNDDLREYFADFFALSIMEDSRYRQYLPDLQISTDLLTAAKEYFQSLKKGNI